MLISHVPVANRLLGSLPRNGYRRLLPTLHTVDLAAGEVLHEAAAPIRHVYFPSDAQVSLLTVVDERSALEIGVVGRDGMVGLDLALGVGVSPVRAVVQRAGTAIRMSAAHFRKEFQASQPMRQLVHGYASGLMSQIAQTAACNRFHDTQKRLARRLLVMRDQVHSDHFYMTHDSLGTVLGVRRVGVTQAAHALKQQGLIDYSRGNIDILDGPGLEAVACSCYLTARVRRGKAGD